MLKSRKDIRVADFFFSQSAIARPVATPPGIPAERLAALTALHATLPAVIAQAKKIMGRK